MYIYCFKWLCSIHKNEDFSLIKAKDKIILQAQKVFSPNFSIRRATTEVGGSYGDQLGWMRAGVGDLSAGAAGGGG